MNNARGKGASWREIFKSDNELTPTDFSNFILFIWVNLRNLWTNFRGVVNEQWFAL